MLCNHHWTPLTLATCCKWATFLEGVFRLRLFLLLSFLVSVFGDVYSENLLPSNKVSSFDHLLICLVYLEISFSQFPGICCWKVATRSFRKCFLGETCFQKISSNKVSSFDDVLISACLETFRTQRKFTPRRLVSSLKDTLRFFLSLLRGRLTLSTIYGE